LIVSKVYHSNFNYLNIIINFNIMQKLLRLSKYLIVGLLMISPLCSYAQIPSPNADAAYNGYVNAFLVTVGTKTPWFCQSLHNRNRSFFWQQCYLITTVEDAYDRNPTPARKQFVSDLVTQMLAQDGTSWTWDGWNDDMQWGIIAVIRAYKITGNPTFLTVAKNTFGYCYDRGWSVDLGGGIWEKDTFTSKCALSNLPQAIAGCFIYQATGDNYYLDISKRCYDWVKKYLLTSTGQVNEGVAAGGNLLTSNNSYNMGLFVEVAAALYTITKDVTYYKDAVLSADYYINKIGGFTTGIMTENHINNGYFGCDQVVRGIANLARENNLWGKYSTFLTANCNAAWTNRRTDYNFTANNFSKATPADTSNLQAMEVQSSVTIQMVTPIVQTLSDTIKATNYNYMSGILSQTCSEGGLNISGVDTGDWIEYVMNVPTTNYYTITYRVAGTTDGSVSFLSNGRVLSTTVLPSTGGLQTWTDVSTLVYLSAGIQSIRFLADKGGWNISKWSVKSCKPISILSSVNGAADKQLSLIALKVGDGLVLKPQPTDGTWSWTGPNGFTSTTRELSFANIQQGGIYTATYTCSEGSTSSLDVIVSLTGCTATPIEPSVKVDKNGTWLNQTAISTIVGDTVFFSPKPQDGIWRWVGPNGFTAITREITINKIANIQAGNYTASYYNPNGCKSSQVFTVGVSGDDACGTDILPYMSVNYGAQQPVDNATLTIGGTISFSPQPADGTWSWVGPNSFTSTSRIVTLTGFTAQQAGCYTAKYTNTTGCTRYKKFFVGVNNCQTISVTPVIQVNGVTTLRSDSIKVKSGDIITMTSPAADGVWQWTGPNNFSSNVNKITIFKIINSGSGNYTVSNFNASGCKSMYVVNIKISAGDDYCGSAIIPYVKVNSGGWLNVTNASLASGGSVSFGPQPTSGGFWRWIGPNGFIGDLREFTLSAVTVANAGIYSASRTTSAGCVSYLNFKVTVDGISAVDDVDAENSGVYVYPNPATDMVTVKNVLANTKITVLDLSGRILFSQKSNDAVGDLKISISNFKSGMYFIKIDNVQPKILKLLKK
jgi:predicted alpha-1,6-mannanase (GH76 family)